MIALVGEPSQLRQEDGATLPDIALREADTGRARQAYVSAAIICGVGAAILRLIEGPPQLGWSASVVSVAAGLVCAAMAWRRRDGSMFTPLEATVAGVMLCVAALAACAHMGPFSAAAAALIILIIALSMGDEKRARVFFGVIVGGYAVLAALVVHGTLPGVTPVLETASALELTLAGLAVGTIVVVSYAYGRAARRTTAAALAKLHQARVAIAGREALLFEVQADLVRLQGGRQGRLSGERVAEYQLFELLGRGGNGEVYRGQSVGSNTSVAVKVLHPNLVSEDTHVDRFFREARLAASLDSKHVVAVRELGMGPDSAPFIVMELLEGRTLTELLRSGGALSLGDAAVLLEQVAAGLTTAHQAGIIHRDIKPSNLVRTEQNGEVVWKVVDFGISKLMAGSGTLTRGALIGTPGYMAPEQAAGEAIDERADVFSLGAVMYRAVTGWPPFSGPDPLAVALDTVQRQPARPSALRKLPRDVDWVLGLALAKKAKARFGSATAFAEAFEAARHERLDEVTREEARAYLARMPWSEPIVSEDEGATVVIG